MNFSSLLETASFRPDRLTITDAWVGHIPFGYWLVKELTPSVIVELGVFSGNSYFCFCQSVKDNKLSTKCYGIDTWKGDEHGGFYDNEIYDELEKYHHNNYSGFSRLMRLTFDEAQKYFLDGSIDLLHIDGLHSYEAVKHDFETWIPKLSKNAVVLFHDINVRERGFGVWRFWNELCKNFQHTFEFDQSNGLGILAITENDQKHNLEFLNHNFQNRKIFKDYFSGLGIKILDQYLSQENHKKILDLKFNSDVLKIETINGLNELNKNLESFSSPLKKLVKGIQQVTSLQNRIEQDSLKINSLNNKIDEDNLKIDFLNKAIIKKNEILKFLENELSETQIELKNYHNFHREREIILEDLNSKLLEIYSSSAWKIIRVMWKIRLLFFPKKSFQEKVIYKIINILKKGIKKTNYQPTSLLNDFSNLSEKMNSEKINNNLKLYTDYNNSERKNYLSKFFSHINIELPFNNPISRFMFLPLLSIGGSEVVAKNFIKLISENNPQEIIILFITDFNICDGKFDFPPNVILINLDEFLETNEFWKKKQFLYDIIRSIKPKTIHNINSSIMWDVIIEKGDEISQFSSIFGNIFAFQFDENEKKIGYAENYLKRSINYLTALISDNKRFITDAIDEYNLFDYSNKMSVIYTPVSWEEKNDLSVVRERLDNYDERIHSKPTLNSVWSGRMDSEKKWDFFLEIVKNSPTSYFYDVFGKPVIDGSFSIPDFPNLNHKGIYKSPREVFLFNEYDAFIFTSKWEGLPNILLEVGLYGIPIIAPSVGGVGELINNETGFLLDEKPSVQDYLSALSTIREYPLEASRRSKNLLELIISRHNWNNFRTDVLRLYNYL